MSANYYFTVASLPLLRPGIDPPLSWEEYVKMCGVELSEADRNKVSQLSLNPDQIKESRGILFRWKEWETALRNSLVEVRSKAKGKPADDKREMVGLYRHDALMKQLVQFESPLEAEVLIDKARWAFLEEEEMGHFFDLQILLVYGLKLLVLHREASFREELGFQKYKEIYEQVMSVMKQKETV